MDKKKQITIMLLVIYSQNSETKAAKTTRPVHEIINEPLRAELDKPRQTPYGNPLEGNSQRARQHALNQQAMFNAERDRQHRAQLQRWTAQPPTMDSYMKAYHESHENHHLALENQQAKLKDNKNQASKALAARNKATAPNEAIRNKPERNRNHRSYGSDYYAQLSKYQNPRYYEGVTIKPNGNIGVTEAPTSLYTEAIPSTQYVYPKQYSQMQNYQSAHDIASLSSLLMKPANDQLSELNALIKSSDPNGDSTDLHKPIDLFFYLKDNPSQKLVEYDNINGPQYVQGYTNEHTEDHKPITEETNDIADPNQQKVTAYGIQPVLTSSQMEIKPETTTTKSNNYYKLEVASQTISSGYKPQIKYKLHEENSDSEDQSPRPDYQIPQYGQQYYYKDEKDVNDASEVYLHHHADQSGIQHLVDDAIGVPAYGDNNENLHYAANYEFGYRVRDQHSGNYFGHHEAKSGENTSGHYHVLLPDGRMQKVKYYAGPSGFHADISYAHLQERK